MKINKLTNIGKFFFSQNHHHGQLTEERKKLFKEHFADLLKLVSFHKKIAAKKKPRIEKKQKKRETHTNDASFQAIAANILSCIFFHFSPNLFFKILLRPTMHKIQFVC